MFNNINEQFTSDTFINEYNEYKKNNSQKIKDFNSFLESISYDKFSNINKSTPKINKSLDYHKNITLNLNKLSNSNINNIKNNIVNIINNNDNILDKTLDIILNKSILQLNYCNNYITLIVDIYTDLNYDYKTHIHTFLDNFKIPTFSTTDDYNALCDNNKKLDILLGYIHLVSYCEHNNIISDKFESVFDKLLDIYISTDNNDEKYRCIQCIYTLFKEFYKDNELPINYKSKLENLLKNETNYKNKFKIMDIIERK